MPQSSSRPNIQTRIPTPLTPILHKRVLAYVTAATAAGVSFLAAQSAEAKIVYTAANMTIPVNTPVVHFDLNNDGVPDFGFYNVSINGARRVPEGTFAAYLEVLPADGSNAIWGAQSNGFEFAAALPAKALVSSNRPFQRAALVMWSAAGNYTNGGTARGPWRNKHHGAYLGLKFAFGGQFHYGWAHVSFKSIGTVLDGYAYETNANKPIHAGQTSGPISNVNAAASDLLDQSRQPTLGLLAHGSRGLSIWRRREQEAA